MPSVRYVTSYKKNTGLLFSAEEFRALYFYGINIKSRDGTDISPSTIEFNIRQAQERVEKYLGIKLNKQLQNENVDYYRGEYLDKFPVFFVNFPVNDALTCIGLMGQVEQVVYPEDWLFNSENNRGVPHRKINIVPVSSATRGIQAGGDLIYTGVMTEIGLRSYQQVPYYWNLQYETGLTEIPYDLMDIIGKYASLGLFAIYGDIAFGTPGLASQSLSIDGLSQTFNSTSSAMYSAFSARITQYSKEIENYMKQLKNHYKGLNFGAC